MSYDAADVMVSAVIPTTIDPARLAFIQQALDSVLNQDYSNFEVVVVHNGSEPARKHLLDAYWSRVKYCYDPIGNIGAARNRGVLEATGKLVAFLDDDDLWLPSKLRVQAAAMRANPDVDVLFTDTELFNDAGVAHQSYIRHVGGLDQQASEKRAENIVVQRGSWFEYLIRDCPFLPSCWMGRREVLLNMPFARTLSEDRELLWRLSRGHMLAYVDQVLTRKRDHATNISLNLEECFAGIVAGARSASDWNLSRQERRLLSRWEAEAHYELGYRCRKRGETSAALRHQVASMRLAPSMPPLKEAVKCLLGLKGQQATDS